MLGMCGVIKMICVKHPHLSSLLVGSIDQGYKAGGPRGESCAQKTLEVCSESPWTAWLIMWMWKLQELGKNHGKRHVG